MLNYSNLLIDESEDQKMDGFGFISLNSATRPLCHLCLRLCIFFILPTPFTMKLTPLLSKSEKKASFISMFDEILPNLFLGKYVPKTQKISTADALNPLFKGTSKPLMSAKASPITSPA